jgi:uncharacterized membrane protein
VISTFKAFVGVGGCRQFPFQILLFTFEIILKHCVSSLVICINVVRQLTGKFGTHTNTPITHVFAKRRINTHTHLNSTTTSTQLALMR